MTDARKNGADKPMSRERVQELLDAYGADVRRWPEADRARLTGAKETDGGAWAEARALDRLLQQTAEHTAAQTPDEALAARIMAAVEPPSNVISIDQARRRGEAASSVGPTAARRVDFGRRAEIAAAALLAASLIMGFFAGFTGLMSIEPLGDVVALVTPSENGADLVLDEPWGSDGEGFL